MITYTTGDLLVSNTESLVNTVNCEGYMGKGIAYQFKLKYPDNFKDYQNVCRNGELKIGKLHYYYEKNKLIINFPTKNKWREKSKIEYIVIGVDLLVELIDELDIKSISIPPLGSGNGGLNWHEVKSIIADKLEAVSQKCNIVIYEPSKSYKSEVLKEPELSLSALLLMKIKLNLVVFNRLRLQKTAYLLDVYSGNDYFRFSKHKYGPYDNSISIISKNIKEYQHFYNVTETEEAYDILIKKLISKNIQDKLNEFEIAIKKATSFINSIESNHEVECVITILHIINENGSINENGILNKFESWSEDKAKRFSKDEILNGINKLLDWELIDITLLGYQVHTYKAI